MTVRSAPELNLAQIRAVKSATVISRELGAPTSIDRWTFKARAADSGVVCTQVSGDQLLTLSVDATGEFFLVLTTADTGPGSHAA